MILNTVGVLQSTNTTMLHKTDLHDEKMWVVDVEANRAEQVLHPGVVGIDSIDEVLVPATNYHLKRKIYDKV